MDVESQLKRLLLIKGPICVQHLSVFLTKKNTLLIWLYFFKIIGVRSSYFQSFLFRCWNVQKFTLTSRFWKEVPTNMGTLSQQNKIIIINIWILVRVMVLDTDRIFKSPQEWESGDQGYLSFRVGEVFPDLGEMFVQFENGRAITIPTNHARAPCELSEAGSAE